MIRSYQRLAVLLLSLWLTGCASSDSQSGSQVAKNQESDGLICRYEKETGSHFKKKVCKTQQQLDKEREQARRTQRGFSDGVNNTGGGSN